MDLIYSQVPGKIREFLNQIPTWGVPEKFTQSDLAAFGYKSSNDRTILGVLRALDVIGPDGRPTPNWQALRNREQARANLAELIRKAYRPLFQSFPEAQKANDVQLRDFFASRSKSGERVVMMAVGTFKALCSMADFSTLVDAVDSYEGEGIELKALPPRQAKGVQRPLSLDVSFRIDASASPESIRAFFTGLRELQNTVEN